MIRDTFGIHQLAIPVYVMCLHGTYLHEKKNAQKHSSLEGSDCLFLHCPVSAGGTVWRFLTGQNQSDGKRSKEKRVTDSGEGRLMINTTNSPAA